MNTEPYNIGLDISWNWAGSESDHSQQLFSPLNMHQISDPGNTHSFSQTGSSTDTATNA